MIFLRFISIARKHVSGLHINWKNPRAQILGVTAHRRGGILKKSS